MIEVTAAIIKDAYGNILICQRPLNKQLGGLWEFPGGKLESGESLEECIIRECQEELALQIKIIKRHSDHYSAPGKEKIHLIFFECQIIRGSMILNEHSDAKWITPLGLSNFQFCPADHEVVKLLQLPYLH
ncbi:MAG TPA: (deoxy)nucleoside triphosphate pyrophosphohydrolase [Arachidicoccus sp.]|nr:(deoxy)nucleoside triphosphate pyrophosphohydrolase [Arachidicoccus sp.]